MAHKRKRSSTTFSPNTSSSTSERDTSQTPSPYPHAYQQSDNDMDTHMSNTSYPLHQIDNWSMTINPLEEPSSHLHSRTRKRFRDGRPDDTTIHETTYAKLFSAAPSSSPVPSLPTPQPRDTFPQSSLHDYWALPHRRSTHLIPPPSTYDPRQTNCEDCDAPLLSGDDVMMMDCDGTDELSCRNCKRWVCEFCAVVDVGKGRECLQCRTSRKRWVGGIGWMSPGVA